jgi:hypothetical protein
MTDIMTSQDIYISSWDILYIIIIIIITGGWNNLVGIATRYRLEGPGIDSRWVRNFPHPGMGLTQPPI